MISLRRVKLVVSAGLWAAGAPVRLVRRVTGRSAPRPIVILCYHNITHEQRARFAQQMDELLRCALPVRLDALTDTDRERLRVAVTFDDGFAGVAENALPELASRGIPCTVFVPTGRMGRKPAWAGAAHDPETTYRVMDAEELGRIVSPLVDLGSHGVSHGNMREMDDASVREELERSREDLRAIAGKEPLLFAFPYGAYADHVCAAAKEIGYRHAFTVVPEWRCRLNGSFMLGRTSVCADDGDLEFRLKVRGAYSWMAKVSWLKRRAFRLVGSHPAAIRPAPANASRRRTNPSRNGLPEGFTAEADSVNEHAWHDALRCFKDATIYQTWPYEEVLWGKSRMSHLLLRREGELVAAAQVRVVRAPILNAGIAYIYRGPMWRLGEDAPDQEVVRAMIAALRREYAERRGLLLRIVPNEPASSGAACLEALRCESFHPREGAVAYRTLLMDLTPGVDELRKGMKHAWRNNLNKSERYPFEVTVGTSSADYEVFLNLYRQMHDRKRFVEHVDVEAFGEIQARLPEALKTAVMIARLDGEPVSAGTCSAIGDMGIQIFMANSAKALEVQSAYHVFWQQAQRLREHGCRSYDLGGIDPEKNPGGYRFKSGLCSTDMRYLGEFEASGHALNTAAVRGAERLRAWYRETKARHREAAADKACKELRDA